MREHHDHPAHRRLTTVRKRSATTTHSSLAASSYGAYEGYVQCEGEVPSPLHAASLLSQPASQVGVDAAQLMSAANASLIRELEEANTAVSTRLHALEKEHALLQQQYHLRTEELLQYRMRARDANLEAVHRSSLGCITSLVSETIKQFKISKIGLKDAVQAMTLRIKKDIAIISSALQHGLLEETHTAPHTSPTAADKTSRLPAPLEEATRVNPSAKSNEVRNTGQSSLNTEVRGSQMIPPRNSQEELRVPPPAPAPKIRRTLSMDLTHSHAVEPLSRAEHATAPTSYYRGEWSAKQFVDMMQNVRVGGEGVDELRAADEGGGARLEKIKGYKKRALRRRDVEGVLEGGGGGVGSVLRRPSSASVAASGPWRSHGTVVPMGGKNVFPSSQVVLKFEMQSLRKGSGKREHSAT